MADLFHWQYSKLNHYIWRDQQDEDTFHFGVAQSYLAGEKAPPQPRKRREKDASKKL